MMVQAPLFPLSLWVDKVRVMINQHGKYDDESIEMEEGNHNNLFGIKHLEPKPGHDVKLVKVLSIQGNGTEIWKRPGLAFSDSWSAFGGHDVLPRLCGRAFWQVKLMRILSLPI